MPQFQVYILPQWRCARGTPFNKTSLILVAATVTELVPSAVRTRGTPLPYLAASNTGTPSPRNAGFLARLAEPGRRVESASSNRFRPPHLGIVGNGKKWSKPGPASSSLAQTTRTDVSRRDGSSDGTDAARVGEVNLRVREH